MMIEKWSGLLVTMVAITTSTGFAAQQIRPEKEPLTAFSQKEISGVATLAIGPVWENVGKTQTFYLTEDIEKTYAANRVSNTSLSGELFLGAQKTLRENLVGQLGLAIAAAGNASLSGNIWDDADPKFDNYIYAYKIRHTHVALKGKLLAENGYFLTPWVSGSIGVGFNEAFDFENVPKIFQAVVMPNFTSHTTTAFTYTVGVGVEKNISQHWRFGVGYEFSDWGKSELGRASGQTVNAGLSLSHVYTNGVLFNLTYSI